MPQQLISVSPSAPSTSVCSTFQLVVRYDTNPPEQDAVGVAFRLHWSSDQLTFAGVDDVYQTPIGVQVQDDTNDLDGDPETDQLLNTVWFFNDNSDQLPIDLYTIVFTATPGFSGTTLRFVGEEPAGFAFDAPPLNVTAAPGGLDVDGTGTADPLTDGVALLRYLFGFRGEVLVEDVIESGCTRCTAAQIECYIESLL